MSELLTLAEKLRRSDGALSDDSMTCLNADSQLVSLRNRVAKLEADSPEKRIAIALEQAAMHGWGNVQREYLLAD